MKIMTWNDLDRNENNFQKKSLEFLSTAEDVPICTTSEPS